MNKKQIVERGLSLAATLSLPLFPGIGGRIIEANPANSPAGGSYGGDAVCSVNEVYTVPQDCGVNFKGDGICSSTEDYFKTSTEDCGVR